MAASGLFRLTSTFEQGFKKEDVLAYVDDLTNKNADLEKEKKALEEALEAGGGSVGGSGVDQAVVNKLEDEKRLLKEQLDQVNDQLEKQESLLEGEKTVREKMQKQFAEEKQRLMSELSQASSSNGESEMLIEQIKEKDEEIENLVEKAKKLESEISEKGNMIIQKEKEISKLQDEIKELKENSDSGVQSTMDIQNVFIEAQNTVKRLTSDAQQKADKRIAEAEAQAEKIINDANAVADKTLSEANKKAEKITADAENSVAEKCRTANEKSDSAIKMANEVKELLLSDIDSVSTEIKRITDIFNQIHTDVSNKISEANDKLNKASSAVKDDKKLEENLGKLADAKSGISSAVNSSNNGSKQAAPAQFNKPSNNQQQFNKNNNIDNKPADTGSKPSVNIDLADLQSAVNNIGKPADTISTPPPISPLPQEEPKKVQPVPQPNPHKKEAKVKNTKISTADWGIDLDAITKQIEEEESKKEKLEEE